MTSSPLTYADLLLRIVKLEARIISLEQQNERGAAPQKYTVDSVTVMESPHWVLGEEAGSTPVGTN
jgi:hypothetical protein